MPALYGITSNANVSVSNTTGLYIGSGNVTILNSAGTLLNLLSNAGTVGFYSTNSGTQVAASVDPSGVTSGTYGSDIAIPVITVGADGRVTSVTVATNAGGTYGNANVTALLSGTVTVGNLITTAGVYWANGQPYSSGSGTIYGNANVAAYLAANTDPTIQSLNANTSQQAAQINTINANVGSFYTYANVTYATNANLASTNANLAAFETYANVTFGPSGPSSYSNANVTSYLPIYSGTIDNSSTIIGINANVTAANAAIQTLNANVGSFYTYANVTYSTIANAASQESEISSLRSNIIAANAAIQTISANLGSFETYANVTYSTIANAASQESEISSLRSNIIAANAAIQTISANLGSFETYANVTYATNANLASTNANLAAFETYANLTFGTSNYANANVAAYLAANTDPTISNLNANTSQQAAQINSINANIGSFYTYANVTYSTIANAASQQAQIDSTNANVLAANAAIQTISANLGSFETYANVTYSTIANAASQQAQIDSTNANVTAANVAIQTLSANLGSFETYANVTFVTTANANTYSNANVASFLPVYNGNLEVANVNISQFATFATITTPAYLKGQVWYDSVQDSLAYYNSITNNEINIGQELQFNVYNGTGSTINQGVPVYLTGGRVGTTPNIAPAQANTISTSQVVGVANQNIPTGTVGCVVTNGLVANVAMGSFSVGDTLYLSPYSAGILQNTVPPTGFICKVGTVVYNNSPNGIFLVNKTVPLNNQYFGNLTLTGNLSANNATITNQLSVGNIIATGTETAGNIITTAGVYWANGVSYGSSFAGTYSNTNVAAYLSGNITTGNITNTGVITATGNITAGNIKTTGNITAGNIIIPDDGVLYARSITSPLFDVPPLIGINAFGNPLGVEINQVTTIVDLRVFANLSVESNVGDVTSNGSYLTVGNTATVGNLVTRSGIYWSNGQPYSSTVIGTYGNTNVATFLSSGFGSNTIVTTGNITAGNIIGNIITSKLSTTGNITAGNVIIPDYGILYTRYITSPSGEVPPLIVLNGFGNPLGVQTNQVTTQVSLRAFANISSEYNGYSPSGYLTVANTATVGNLITTGGVYWANGAAYSSSSGSGSIYGNSNVATFLSSGFGSNTIVTTGNITAGNITNTGVITSTGNITAPYYIGTAQYFSGNLAGNVLYDGLKNAANIQAAAFGNINPINSSALSQYQQSGQGGVGTAAPGSISPAPAVYTYFSGNGVTAMTTAGIASMISQANVTVRTSAAIQTIVGQSFQTQGYGLGAGNMSTNDRIKGQIAAMELWPQGATWGSNQFKSQTGTDFVPYTSTSVAVAIQAQLSLTGSGNVSSAASISVLSYVAPTVGAMNVNYVTGYAASVGYASYANVSGIGISTINVARGLLVIGNYGNAATPTNQVINNLYGVHLPTNWENNGTAGKTITYLKRSLQSEDVNTDLYNAGNVIIGGNLITTSTTAPITFNGPTTHNNNVTVAGSNSLLKVTTFTVTALNAITGSTGQFAAVSDGTGKSGGQMAYWDTTNSRWSWFDTNLAVS